MKIVYDYLSNLIVFINIISTQLKLSSKYYFIIYIAKIENIFNLLYTFFVANQSFFNQKVINFQIYNYFVLFYEIVFMIYNIFTCKIYHYITYYPFELFFIGSLLFLYIQNFILLRILLCNIREIKKEMIIILSDHLRLVRSEIPKKEVMFNKLLKQLNDLQFEKYRRNYTDRRE